MGSVAASTLDAESVGSNIVRLRFCQLEESRRGEDNLDRAINRSAWLRAW
jgi:hypothetical protein